MEDAKARLDALGEYFRNKHGINLAWVSDTKASINGKYLVVKIEGEMNMSEGKVVFSGRDPGMMWRKKATKYIHGKLDDYFDPNTPVDALPRS